MATVALAIAGIALVAVAARLVYSALRDAGHDADTNFSSAPVGAAKACGPAAPCGTQANPLSEAAANAEFKKLAAQKDIPFDYPQDCCYSRAHEMGRIMKSDGIESGKVWNYAHNYPDDGLSVKTPNAPGGEARWRYHVAPVVAVKGQDGVTRDMVFDPSIFDKPVPVQEWVKIQSDPLSKLETSDNRYYFKSPGNVETEFDDDYKKTAQELKNHAFERDLLKAAP